MACGTSSDVRKVQTARASLSWHESGKNTYSSTETDKYEQHRCGGGGQECPCVRHVALICAADESFIYLPTSRQREPNKQSSTQRKEESLARHLPKFVLQSVLEKFIAISTTQTFLKREWSRGAGLNEDNQITL